MNNLKRVLSLALASVMLIGMMVVGASAADFTDAEEIEHQEAVDVLVALGIINGKEDGSYFAPADNVTRGEMAKMIAVAMMGGNDINTGTKTVPSFTDIGGHWAESYIEYCYDMGIIAGRGDGTFDPNANVTGTEVTKMMLSALGYDADAYKLTGATWATRTDELARIADPSLYDELVGVVLNTPATRDTAAQIVWNGLQNTTRKVSPSQNTSNGEVTWDYVTGNTLLKVRYDADIFVGTFEGNHKSTAQALNEGEIYVDNATRTYYVNGEKKTATAQTASFPSDLDISHIGEEVKVIYRNGNNDKSDNPDNKDTIYGTFVTGTTQVYWTTQADIKKATDVDDADKIKFNGTEYTVAPTTTATKVVVRDYGATVAAASDTTAANDTNVDADGDPAYARKLAFSALNSSQNSNKVKFVTDSDGRIAQAYVESQNISYVTSVSGNKVTLNGVGTINIDKNDIYDDVAKYDVVNYTKFYKADKDQAFFTVTKAEAVTGELTAFKNDGKWVNLTLDGKTYKVEKKPTTLASVSIDSSSSETAVDSDDIGEEFTLYLLNGYVGYVFQDTDAAAKLAVVIEEDIEGNKLGDQLKNSKVRLLLADGTKINVTLNEDSVLYRDGATTKTDKDTNLKAGTTPEDKDLASGDIVRYSVSSDGTYKLIEVIAAAEKEGYQLFSITGTTEKVYDKDTKTVLATGNDAVTSGDCILFTGNGSDGWKVYNIRDLKDITLDDENEVDYFSYVVKDGKAIAAYLNTDDRPSGASTSTIYGIVSAYNGTATNPADGDKYQKYTVENDNDSYTVYMTQDESNKRMKGKAAEGSIISFAPSADNVYTDDDLAIYDGTDYANAKKGLATWVKEYDAAAKTLTYYTSVAKQADGTFKGLTTKTVALDDDVVIVYVNSDDDEAGSDVGVSEFDTSTGYRNVLLVKDTGDSKAAVAVIMESSRDADILGGKTVTPPTAITRAGTTGNYTITVSTTAAAAGETVTVTVTCDKLPTAGTDTVTVTTATGGAVTPAGGNKTFKSDGSDGTVGFSNTYTFTMPDADVNDIVVNVANA